MAKKTKSAKLNKKSIKDIKIPILIESVKIGLLEEVSAIVGGKNSKSLVDLLFNKLNVNEFIIAKKLSLTINQTRNILYKLSDEGLVTSIRKKDKKKGWYTYFWTFNIDRSLFLLKKIILNEIEQLERQLKSREVKRFYICKTCNVEITEENALLHNFTCPECEQVYELNDNAKAISELNLNINKLKKRMEDINKEMDIIDVQKHKKMERDKVKFEKNKKEIRAEKMAERKKLRDKLKKSIKKHINKKDRKVVKHKTKKAVKHKTKKAVKHRTKKAVKHKTKKAVEHKTKKFIKHKTKKAVKHKKGKHHKKK